MKDRFEILGRKLLKHLDIVGIVFFALLLAGSFLLYNREQNWRPDPVSPPAPAAIDEKFVLTTDEGEEELDEDYSLVMSNVGAEQVPFEQDSQLNIVTRVNPFNPKSIAREAEAMESVASEIRQATRLFENGDVAGAERMVDEILRRVPTHRGATLLKQRITEMREQDAPAEEGAAEAEPAS